MRPSRHFTVQGRNFYATHPQCHTLQLANMQRWAGTHVNFTRAVYPAPVHSLPLVYMLSGADLLTAWSLFPDAPSYHLFSEFPPGIVECFTNQRCRDHASDLVAAYFLQWCLHDYAWTASDDQRRWFHVAVPVDGFEDQYPSDHRWIGTLPVLVFMLHMMGHNITGFSPADSRGFIRGVVISTTHSTVTYTGGYLGDDRPGHGGMVSNSTLMAAHLANRTGWQMPTVSGTGQPYPAWRRQLELLSHTVWRRHAERDGVASRRERPFLYMFKSAPIAFLRDGLMGTFVTRTAAAVIQDDASLPLWVYSIANASKPSVPWAYTCYGKWAPYGRGDRTTYAMQRLTAKACSFGLLDELPFSYGYGYSMFGNRSINGTLVTAWRVDIDDRTA